MRRLGGTLVTVILVIAGLVGFHWITYPANQSRTFCVLPKDHLTFDATVLTADSRLLFAVQHPILHTRIMSGAGLCLNR